MRTEVCVDGFNLYYGALKDTGNKWVDLDRLCSRLLPNTQVQKIMYFTARVVPKADDPDQHIRQNTYFRALKTNPKVEIVFGHFLSHPVRMPTCSSAGVLDGKKARVMKTEEKGSDVNLASYMLLGAARDQYDQAIVISNDSDLLTPIKIVRREFGKRVGILNPHRRPSQVLQREADFVRPIRQGALGVSQFPHTLDNGSIRKPLAW